MVMKRTARQIAKRAAQVTIGKLPPDPRRLSGPLAKHGGKPVRDVRFRPWPPVNNLSFTRWTFRLAPALRHVFRIGLEGQPHMLSKQFAQAFATYCGCRYGLLVGHGTDALRLALASTLDHDGLDYGGEIIVPNLTFIASATSAIDRHFGVALVDVDSETHCIDSQRVEQAILPGKTRAIMAVHLYGQPANMTALREIANRYRLKLVEDAAQAHGAIWETGPVGSLGDAAAFSFQSSKNLNCGEGGLFVTNDAETFERAYAIHDVGRRRVNPGRWAHHSLGWNMRLNEYAAAVLLDRLRDFESEQQRRVARYTLLSRLLEEVPCVRPLAIHPRVKRHGVYMMVIRYFPELCDGLRVDDFIEMLQKEGLPVYRGYESTVSRQPIFQKIAAKHPDLVRVLPTPVADDAVRNTLYIPQQIFRGTERDMVEIAAAFRKVQDYYTQYAKASGRQGSESTSMFYETAVGVTVGSRPKPMRIGIIGLGMMGSTHAEVLSVHPAAQLFGATDVRPEAKRIAQKFGTRWYETPEQLIADDQVDAVVIATPHWDHPRLSALALKADKHVICEKPLAVSVAEADELLSLARDSRGLFAVVFQSRFEPVYRRAKELLSSGDFGQVLRISLVEASWRSQAYYGSSSWRGTWKGEGGGVLVNQAPHALDRYAWLFGMPVSVMGQCGTLLHRMETEDVANAMLRHRNGAHGFIHVSINEFPPVSRFEVFCEAGRISVEQGNMTVTRFKDSVISMTMEEQRLVGSIVAESHEFPGTISESPAPMLPYFYDNIARAVIGEANLVCPAAEALHAVELGNAIMFSSGQGREVNLPLDRSTFTTFLDARGGSGNGIGSKILS